MVIPTVKNCIYGLADSTSSYIACVQEKFDILITIYIVLTHTDHREDVDSQGEIIYKSLRNDYLFKVNSLRHIAISLYNNHSLNRILKILDLVD